MASFLGDILSGILGNESTDKAADSMVNATKQANQTQMDMFNRSIALGEPNRLAGLNALSMQGSLLGNPNMVSQDAVAASVASNPNAPVWNDYSQANPDVLNYYNQNKAVLDKRFGDQNGYMQWHYNNYGQPENRGLPGYSSGQTSGGGGTGVQTGISTDDAYDMFNNSGFAKSMLETTNSDMERMIGQYGAAGNALSGSALKGLNDVNRRNTSSAFGNYYNALSGISGTGAQIGQSQGQQAIDTGSSIAKGQQNIGNIRGSSYLNRYNAGDAYTDLETNMARASGNGYFGG